MFMFSFPDEYNSIRQNPLRMFWNRKSETYVPLNTLLGIRHTELSSIRSGTKVQIRERYTYFYIKKLPREKSFNKVSIKFCEIVKYVFLLFLDLQKCIISHNMAFCIKFVNTFNNGRFCEIYKNMFRRYVCIFH